MTTVVEVVLDPTMASPFPRIHEGRYEVDPWATGLLSPVPEGLGSAVRRAGIRLLRVGLGCWLPSQDPHPSTLPEREWFRGSTMADVDDPAFYDFTHLDRTLDVCLDLGVDVLLSVDFMPRSLAKAGPPPEIPASIRHAAPGYTFPDGVRSAPPADPEVFAAAAVRVVEHVRARGVGVRYVELWNEPDLPFFYSGTFTDYLATYRAFSRRLAAEGYLVGGPSWSGLFDADDWRDNFCRAIARERLPLHFYSLHRYNDDRTVILDACRQMRRTLDEYGLTGTELLLDEWGYDLRDADYFGTVGNAAFIASALMALPGCGVTAQTHVLLVDPVPETGPRLHGLTRKDGDPNPIFHALVAFEDFQRTPLRIPTPVDDLVLAGVDRAGQRLGVLVVNPEAEAMTVRIRLADESARCDVHRLTQASYDAGCAWASEPEVTMTTISSEFVLPPLSLLRLEGELSLEPRVAFSETRGPGLDDVSGPDADQRHG